MREVSRGVDWLRRMRNGMNRRPRVAVGLVLLYILNGGSVPWNWRCRISGLRLNGLIYDLADLRLDPEQLGLNHGGAA